MSCLLHYLISLHHFHKLEWLCVVKCNSSGGIVCRFVTLPYPGLSEVMVGTHLTRERVPS